MTTAVNWKCLCGFAASHRCPSWLQTGPARTGCATTQHCVTWDWCHRCNPALAEAARHAVKAIAAAGIEMPESSAAYGQVMNTLRKAATEEPTP